MPPTTAGRALCASENERWTLSGSELIATHFKSTLPVSSYSLYSQLGALTWSIGSSIGAQVSHCASNVSLSALASGIVMVCPYWPSAGYGCGDSRVILSGASVITYQEL